MGTRPAQIVVGFTESAVNQAVLADNIVKAHNSGSDRFKFVNEVGQVIAAFSSAIPILAPVSIQGNTFAATVTFLHIVVELEETGSLNAGDTVTLIGNIAGIVATVAIMAGTAPVTATVATATAITAGAYGLIGHENFMEFGVWVNVTAARFWPEPPVADMSDFYFDVYGQARRYNEIAPHEFGGFVLHHNGSGSQMTLVSVPKPVHHGNDDPWIDHPYRVAINT
jgi:hypothetical protein